MFFRTDHVLELTSSTRGQGSFPNVDSGITAALTNELRLFNPLMRTFKTRCEIMRAERDQSLCILYSISLNVTRSIVNYVNSVHKIELFAFVLLTKNFSRCLHFLS
jgi:hypothetical protein